MGRAIPRPVGRWRFRSQGLGAFSEPSAPPRMKTRTWSSHLSADVCIGRAQCHPPRKASGRPRAGLSAVRPGKPLEGLGQGSVPSAQESLWKA